MIILCDLKKKKKIRSGAPHPTSAPVSPLKIEEVSEVEPHWSRNTGKPPISSLSIQQPSLEKPEVEGYRKIHPSYEAALYFLVSMPFYNSILQFRTEEGRKGKS